ncbi:MAG: hypothetical protein JWO59_2421, partial [Chloroflexi bacterium]|nr:hypothetical protein [Chloroflexota bacterium]
MFGFRPLTLLRFIVAYALTFGLAMLSVGAIASLFLAQDAQALVFLSVSAALVSVPLIVSPLSDWVSWLVVQVLGVVAAVHFAGSPVALAHALNNLPDGILSFTFPSWAPLHGTTITLGRHSGAWTLLLLLGLLTWELTWGMLWLILRAGYVWSAIVMAGATLLAAAGVVTGAGVWFLPFTLVSLALVLWHTWSGRLVRAARQVEPLRPRLSAASSLLGGLAALALIAPIAWAGPLPGRTNFSQWANQMWSQIAPTIRDPLHLLNKHSANSLTSAGFGPRLNLDGPFRPYPGLVMRIRGVPAGMQP